ncbi:BQ5605_C002g01575 [Microbotryum silenes-dioicae]|uniref:BQ5605_C002g01575 protein n=1 Tax=Microbotryum silenes-dioicae TaxID=796604 RepID=A0A2X0ML37_9BASI|nr:BQ5605_C002g01575 [Microbotryum silenes-dioicae]
MRKGACAGLESRSNPSSPTFSQGKLREGSDSDAKAFRENARSYNNALSFTSLAAHWDQTQVGTLGPPVFRKPRPTLQRSTLTKLESKLRTDNRFAEAGAPTTFLRQARKWRCLSAIPTPSWEIVHRKTFSRCTVINVPMVGPITKSLARSIRLRCLSGTHYSSPRGKMASTLTFLFARSTKLGHSLPKDRDEEEGDEENGDGERRRSSTWGRGGEPRVHNSFAYYLHEREEPAWQSTSLPSVQNLRLTTAQGINGLTPDQIGRSMTSGSTFKNRPRDIMQRYQDAMALHWGRTTKHATVRISLHECLKPSPATSDMQAVRR